MQLNLYQIKETKQYFIFFSICYNYFSVTAIANLNFPKFIYIINHSSGYFPIMLVMYCRTTYDASAWLVNHFQINSQPFRSFQWKISQLSGTFCDIWNTRDWNLYSRLQYRKLTMTKICHYITSSLWITTEITVQ